MSEDSDVGAFAAVIDDECSRSILAHAHDQYMSVSELADRCDVSEPTIYRRLEQLRELDLVVERTRPDEQGHHFREFQTNLDSITIEVTDRGVEAHVSRREPMAKRLTKIVERL